MLDSVVGPVRKSLVELLGWLLVLGETLQSVEFGWRVKIHSSGDVDSFLGLWHASRSLCKGIAKLRIRRQVYILLRGGVDGIEAAFFCFGYFSRGLVSFCRLNGLLFVVEGKHRL